MNQAPFQKNAQVDKPGIVGARWWHAALADQGAQVVRRDAIRNILIASGVLAGLGTMLAFCGYAASSSSSGSGVPSDAQEQRKTTLDMQKAYGWSFGAVGESLVFDGTSTTPFDKAALATIAADLQPARSDLLPFFIRTLFEAGYATPTAISTLAPEEAAGFQPLADVMKPLHTAAMDTAYARGKALASVFAALADTGGSAGDAKAGVLVDLSGPEAVAFAAGAADIFDPVFLFDNWPHPRGVVRSHETLAAATYYQPLFAKARSTTAKKPPMFVVDRRRLSSYTDDATQFDNRYVAKLPMPGSQLKSVGVNRLLYIVPTSSDVVAESDDLNDEFVQYQGDGIEVRPLSADAFTKASVAGRLPPGAKPNSESDRLLEDSGGYYYGGSPDSHHSFFLVHPWVSRPPRPATSRPPPSVATSYVPKSRTTSYSSTTRPTNFGTVPVLVAVGTGVVVGARYSRSGSWNRSSGGGWSG